MPKELLQAALDGGFMEGFSIVEVYPKGPLLEKKGEWPKVLRWYEIAENEEFWKGLGKSKGWNSADIEAKFAEYIRLDYHNLNTDDFFNTL